MIEVRGAVWVRDAETGKIKYDLMFWEYPDWWQMAIWSDPRLTVEDRHDILRQYEKREAA